MLKKELLVHLVDWMGWQSVRSYDRCGGVEAGIGEIKRD